MSAQDAQATSLASLFSASILETIFASLSAIFLAGANNDAAAARRAAAEALAAYRPRTVVELRLAATIICFGFHALEALSQAANPDLPLARVLRLRGSAVSLSREAEGAQRRLDQLQQYPCAPVHAQPEPQQPEIPPKIEQALNLIEDTRTVAAAAKATGQTWTQAYEARQREQRIAASLKRAEARIAAAQTIPPNQTPLAAI